MFSFIEIFRELIVLLEWSNFQSLKESNQKSSVTTKEQFNAFANDLKPHISESNQCDSIDIAANMYPFEEDFENNSDPLCYEGKHTLKQKTNIEIA